MSCLRTSMTPRHPLETVVLALVAASLVVGVASAWLDVRWFERVYVTENGPIEWATAVALLTASGASVWTVWRSTGARGHLHAVTWIGLALFCFFAAGEELSWGQHLFHFASPAYFIEHNTQHEMNLHNLVVAGVKVNKLVFSQLLIVCAALFLFVLPVLHRRSARVARVVDAVGVPVPRLIHVVAIVATFAGIALVPSRQRDELLEFGASTIFVLILLFPHNAAAIHPVRTVGDTARPAALGASR